ncbi:MAG: AAA family ATPase [Chloroflexi bacterium]|nr:AAA family ATPase [Chloroflexota bacterium]
MSSQETTSKSVVAAQAATGQGPAAPMDSMLDHGAFMWERNKRRLLILLLLIAFAVVLFGVRGIIEGLVGLVASAPSMLVLLLFYAFAMIAQFGVLMWFLSRPRTYTVTPDSPQIGLSFDNYRGQPDLLEHAKSTVRILQGIHKFRAMGGEPPKGMLLAGAPGTGKSFLAGIIAAEADLPFIYVDASSMTSMWFGMDALIVMSLFGKARKLGRKYAKPGHPGACILFIDELDSIGRSRGGVMGGQQQGGMGPMGMMGMSGFALNTMLNQMDSLGQHIEDRRWQKFLRWLGVVRGPVPPKPVVFVIGATNRPDVLDIALTRPGRLDRKLNVYVPDGEGRRDIIDLYLAQKAHDPNINIDLMVQDSVGWTPVDIKTNINEALIVAHDNGRDRLNYRDWLTARDMRQLGLKQPITKMTPDDKRAIAYHEAGHAVVAHYVRTDHRILKASIIRMGDALGVVQRSDREERYTRRAHEIEADIMIALGSRAVEEEFLQTKMTGADSDMQTATYLAMSYCGQHGMGPSLLAVPSQNALGGVPEPLMRIADKMLDMLYVETRALVREKAHAVHAVANALLEKGELIGEELDEIFAMVNEAHPEMATKFERKPLELPKPFEEGSWRKSETIPLPESVPAAATEGPATPKPGATSPWGHWPIE